METFDFFSFLTMLGGLAMFLFGMNQMGDGLERASSGKLESMLDKLTSNRIRAVALGAAVTAIIQSSSATTVTVVGFVNSGVMKLGQAVPIIMGSNIGTTITSWILSLAGIESSNFIIQMLKPMSFSPILAIIGSGMVMFSKNDNKKTTGGIFLGFAVMMYGMNMMSEAMDPLSEDPGFQQLSAKQCVDEGAFTAAEFPHHGNIQPLIPLLFPDSLQPCPELHLHRLFPLIFFNQAGGKIQMILQMGQLTDIFPGEISGIIHHWYFIPSQDQKSVHPAGCSGH